MADEEVSLTGGSITPVVRVGATVRRAIGPWTPAVHALLRHLETVGFDGAPRLLGVDAQGREVLTYIDGEAGYFDTTGIVLPGLWSDAVVVDAARLLRRFHDATSRFSPLPRAHWQLVYPDRRQHEVICHNDFAPYNCIFRRGRLQAMIDFDMAGPGPRLWDVAYAAYRFVPLVADANRAFLQLPEPPDHGRRLRLFCDAYGLAERGELVDMLSRRVQAVVALFLQRAAAGDAPFQRFVAEGRLEGYEADIAFLHEERLRLQHSLTQDRGEQI